MKKFSIPEGTRDLILGESKVKKELQDAIESVFDSYGYNEIVTPSIEYYQTYQTGFDNVKDEQMYKFFDQNGSILTLRMDMTVPIARVAATKFKDQKPPLRFRYCANVFKVKENYSGKRNEVSDCGIELLGLSDQESDLEILVCALEVMENMLQESYTLEIGNVNFFLSACQEVKLSEEEITTLADLIDRKSLMELETYLQSLPMSEIHRDFFNQLPWLCGKSEILESAKAVCFNEYLITILDELSNLYEELKELGYQDNITFDLGKVPHLNYYSGIIFEGYIEGIGTSVLSGGRYDTLLEKFGDGLPAIGFSVKLDYVVPMLTLKQEEKETIRLLYPLQQKVKALQQAQELRKSYRVILCPTDVQEISIEKEDTK
ncbi:MAG: ATP phosphoribosyltransferase regulatory subunit [Longicatena sp.]